MSRGIEQQGKSKSPQAATLPSHAKPNGEPISIASVPDLGGGHRFTARGLNPL